MAFATSNTEGVNVSQYTTVSSSTPEYPNPPFAVGTVVFGDAGAAWVYVQASANVTATYACVISTTHTIQHLTTTTGLRGLLVGFPSIDIPSGSYGWVQVKGPASVQVLASAAANTRLNTTATAGAMDDDGTASTKEVLGIALTTSRAASQGSAPAMLNWPAVGVTL